MTAFGDALSDVPGLDLDAVAAREQRANRLASLAVGLRTAEGRRRSVAVGLADADAGVLAESRTPYRIGSITKTFTAVVVLRLVQDGELDLDERVATYLPDTAFGRVPLRALLAHAGGVQREAPVNMWASMTGPTRDELRAAFGRVEMVGRPGQRWHYSNLGFAVLGQVVEEVTGKPCAALIDTELIGPLGLRSTTWSRPAGAAVGYRTDPYADLVHREPDMDQRAIGVAGQLWSTVDDLLTWGDALAGGAPDVVPEAVVGAMHTVTVMVDRERWTSAWGLGLILDRRPSRVLAGHTGAMPGFLAGLSLDRTSRTVAAALTNVTRGLAAGRVSADLVDAALNARPPDPSAPWAPGVPVPEDLEGVLGRWWSEADETVFSWRDGRLHAELASAPDASGTWFELVADDAYRAEAGRMAGERLTVTRDHAGVVVGLKWATYPFTREPR